MNENTNIYFRARKAAAIYNERLHSREGAAELLGLSVSTLADYELGITKFVPVDKVVLMADLYNCPELKSNYCKKECPIGKCFSIATEVKGIEGIALRLIREFDSEEIRKIQKILIDIAADGAITTDEIPELKEVVSKLDKISYSTSELKLVGEKILNKMEDKRR